MQWFYAEKITLQQRNGNSSYDDIYENHHQILIKLWVLADRFLIRQLQNEAIDKLNSVYRGLGSESLSLTYGMTTDGSPLRKYAVARLASLPACALEGWTSEAFPKQMLFDMVLLYSKHAPDATRIRLGNPITTSDYHVPEYS